jgi:hypothetical protein
MTGKLEKKGLKTATLRTKQITLKSSEQLVRRRGRPKGAKNKPKQIIVISEPPPILKKKGRPKGAKNKPKAAKPANPPQIVRPVVKVSQVKQTEKRLQSKKPAEVKTPPPPAEHVLLTAVRWVEKNMHPSQVQYYRARASRAGITIHHSMISDILGFFNVRECELTKQIKKNNFIASTQNHELHQ